MLPLQGVQVLSLVREARAHTLCSMTRGEKTGASVESVFLGNILFSGNLKLRNCESSVRNKRIPYTLPN